MLMGKGWLIVLCSPSIALGSLLSGGTIEINTVSRSSLASRRFLIKLSTQNEKTGLDSLDEQNRQDCDNQIRTVVEQFKGAQVHHFFNFARHCSLSIEAEEGVLLEDISMINGVAVEFDRNFSGRDVQVLKIVQHGNSPISELQNGNIIIPAPEPPFECFPGGPVNEPTVQLGPVVLPPSSAYRNNTFAPHVETEVNIMHDLGLLGDKDVSVCLVDTGVDYFNSRLGGGFGFGYKIAMGYDFVGDDMKHSGPSPFTTCADHGTHATGIVGADFDSDFKFSGVAPNVILGHYRAFPCSGGSPEDIVAAALLRAYTDGCKVITLSLGGPSAWGDGLLADAVTYVTNLGSLVVSSCGNFGRQGPFYGDVPGELPEVLGTAATDLTQWPIGFILDIVDSTHRGIPYFSVFPVAINDTLDVLYIPSSITDDPNCDPTQLPRPKGDLKNSLLVLKLGQCPQKLLLKWALGNNLRIAMVYSEPDDATVAPNYYRNHFVPGLDYLLFVHASSANKLISYYNANGGKLRVSFAAQKRAFVKELANHVSGGNVAFYSSYGPTPRLDGFGKTLAAPGTNILSTLNVAQGGTSMACPLAAGIAALLFSHREDENLTPFQVRSLMATTARPLRIGQKTKDPFATVVHQGAGIVSAYRAYIARTLIEPYTVTLGDVKNFRKSHNITLTNTNKHAVTYTFGSVSSQTVTTYDKGASIDVNPSGAPGILGAAASVTFSSRSLKIAAGKSATFTATFAFPQFSKKDLQRVPIVSGCILIYSPNDPVKTYRVAYAGVATGLQVMPVLDSTDVASPLFGIPGMHHPFITIGNSSNPNALPSTAADVLYDPTKVTSVHRKDGISIFVRFAMATRYSQVDLVDADTKFQSTILTSNNAHLAQGGGASDSNGVAHDLPRKALLKSQNPALFASVSIIGTVATGVNATRDATDFTHLNSVPSRTFSFNGLVSVKRPLSKPTTKVAAGKPYRILVR
ncbi:BQ2448_110 [Microbotryum intermedium]|uniref:BQ2448_110 protein n=1 Tax=Microbotryum intermedium TaxID=269621 RepID=A0A238F5G9_9BASI|nr:BQ2448_110 [Microbotryum intermedium]